MPFSLYKRVLLDKLDPTNICLRMADKSTAVPIGIYEDVPVKVGNCLILTDFVVLEMSEDENMSIILGRSFLNTAGAVIDCNKGKVTFNDDDKEHMLLQSISISPELSSSPHAGGSFNLSLSWRRRGCSSPPRCQLRWCLVSSLPILPSPPRLKSSPMPLLPFTDSSPPTLSLSL